MLVRARAHLDALLPALRAAGIPFAAVELDALAERQAVLDLASLTHALVQPADRLAWLAVLRAPWCGLALPDLFAVAAAADAHGGSIPRLVLAGDAVEGLTADGAARFARVAAGARAGARRARAHGAPGARARRVARVGRAGDARGADRSRCRRALLRAPGRARGRGRRARMARVRRRARAPARDARCRRGRARAGDDAAPGERARVRHGDSSRSRAQAGAGRRRDPALAPAPERPDARSDEGARRRRRPDLRVPAVPRRRQRRVPSSGDCSTSAARGRSAGFT